jgi:isopentenyldiphosphate isomerase
MEYLDIYDKNGHYLGKEDRNIVHRDALWHNTVHCWLYDKEGNIYFQIRKEEQKLYTTSSGHVKAGETIKEGFGREIEEEIGIKVDYDKAEFVNVYKFIMDKEQKDGSIFKDRAFSNIYVCIFNGLYNDFNFDDREVSGLVKVNAKQTLELLKKGTGKVTGVMITKESDKNIARKKEISFEKFLVNKGETAIGKYGDVLMKVIALTTEGE